jgi:hypothetical protein
VVLESVPRSPIGLPKLSATKLQYHKNVTKIMI